VIISTEMKRKTSIRAMESSSSTFTFHIANIFTCIDFNYNDFFMKLGCQIPQIASFIMELACGIYLLACCKFSH
jgi:hypothetical protein